MKPITERIAALERRKANLEAKIAAADALKGSFPLGAGYMRPSQSKRHEARLERTVKAAAELAGVRSSLKHLEAVKRGVDAGECYETGQPRADRPSLRLSKDLNVRWGQWLKATLKLPCAVELACNGRTITLLRVNTKTVVLEGEWDGDTWDCMDVRPLAADGSNQTTAVLCAAFQAWERSVADFSA
jgi:hypothetical protein